MSQKAKIGFKHVYFQNEHEKVRPLGCVVSLGTGRVPVVPRDHIDMYIPSGIVEGVRVVKGLTAFMGLLIDQVNNVRGVC